MVRTPGHRVGTVFDSFPYYKPSINRIVIRSKGVNRTSEKVKKINEKVADAKPAIAAHRKCLEDHPEFGKHCPIQYFRK